MNRDDIIRLAQEAGGRIEHIGTNIAWCEFLPKNLERFAALVIAAEREACAQSCIETGATKGSSDDALDMADSCAAAIRARGEK